MAEEARKYLVDKSRSVSKTLIFEQLSALSISVK